MKKLALAAITTAALMTTAASTWAISYTYSFSGAELMDFIIASAPDNTTPASLGIYEGARKYTFTSSTGPASWYSWQATTSQWFKEWTQDTSYKMTSFNFWGFGNYQTADATSWGEKFLVNSPWSKGQADKNWVSDIISDSGTLGKDVLAFGSQTGYYNGLSFNGTNFPTFTFTVDLDKATTPWYQGVDGQLVFWFAGNMVNDSDYGRGTLQGNMILAGTPVPEPATMLIFGAGLAGLAATARRRKAN